MADGQHTYILQLSPHLRNRLVDDAHNTSRSMNEIIRQVLCWRYAMECPEMSQGKKPINGSAENIPLRVSKELFDEVRYESEQTDRSIRQVILAALEEHYELTV